jgi:hypothetical protein
VATLLTASMAVPAVAQNNRDSFEVAYREGHGIHAGRS